jgi:hypothetical protein
MPRLRSMSFSAFNNNDAVAVALATASKCCERASRSAIAPSVLLKGKALLEDPDGLARAVETAFFKHVFTRYYARNVGFSYWRGKNDREVDIISDLQGTLVPFEVKYRPPAHTGLSELKGMAEFCDTHNVKRGYAITRDLTDFKVQAIQGAKVATHLQHPRGACLLLAGQI